MTTNTAAWLTAEKGTPLEVKTAPYWTPSSNEILLKNHALAINPIDHYIQAFSFFPMDYPTILGGDVAGEVVEVGPDVTRFKKGDRVVGNALGPGKNFERVEDRNCESGFQAYTILKEHVASGIPDDMSYANAVVLPCGLNTAACAFFQDPPFLRMQYPTEPAQRSTGKTVLIWGGSSSVGSNGVQLAVAAGYEVISTASPKNFEYVKKLGASQVLDYNTTTVVQHLIDACKGRVMAGALDCIGGSATVACMDVMQKLDGNRAVVSTKPRRTEVPEGVTFKHVVASAVEKSVFGPVIWADFLPKALKAGSFVPAPEPLVVGEGLQYVQDGIDLVRKGVSASKIVVSL